MTKIKHEEGHEEAHRLYKRLYSLFKSKSKQRGLDFELDFDEFVLLVSSECEYCGSGPSNQLKYGGDRLKYNGIDRIDSSKGYTSKNCLSSCRFCNSLKGPMKPETWFQFVDSVSKHRRTKLPLLVEHAIEGDSAASGKSFHRY